MLYSLFRMLLSLLCVRESTMVDHDHLMGSPGPGVRWIGGPHFKMELDFYPSVHLQVSAAYLAELCEV